MDGEMMRSSTKGQTMVLNQISRRQLKRQEASGRLKTKRLINFDSLQLSGKKSIRQMSSSLYQNIATTLKENVDPEIRISQNIDDFWAVERQKRISAVARRKLSGIKGTSQEISQQPVEDRKTRHARSRRVGGRRTLGAKPKKLEVYIDGDLIADWDKEDLEVEEEEPCTIASSEALISAQETALRASLPLLNARDHRVEAVPGTCSPAVKDPGLCSTTHTQVEACTVDRERKEQTPLHDNQGDAKSSSSLEDMELSTGEYSDLLMQKIMDPQDRTPDLASLIEMDCTSPPPRVALENILESEGRPRRPLQDAAGTTLDKKSETFYSRIGVRPNKSDEGHRLAGSRADQRRPVSDVHFSSRRLEHEGRTSDGECNMSSVPVHRNLDKDAMCANRDSTPAQDRTSQRPCSPMTSPTPPADPIAVYVSRKKLSDETCELGQRKLAFGSFSPSSSLDIGEDFQKEEIPELDIEWDKIMYDGDCDYVDFSECDYQVENTHRPRRTPEKSSCFVLDTPYQGSDAEMVHAVPHQGTESGKHACDVTRSQESCSIHVKTSAVKSESRHKSGSKSSTESSKVVCVLSPGVDGPQASMIKATKMMQADTGILPEDAEALSLEVRADEDAETPRVGKVQDPAFSSDKTKQSQKISSGKTFSPEGPNEDTPRCDEPPFSPIKSIKMKQVEKTRLSSAAKSLRFEGADEDGPRVRESPLSASKSVRNKLSEKRRLSSAAKALSFEVTDVEGAVEDERAESLIIEPPEAIEPEVTVPVDTEENISQLCASLEIQPDSITAETQTCLASQSGGLTAEAHPCTNLRHEADNITIEKFQSEPQEQKPQAKRPRRKGQNRRCSLEGGENGLTWKDGLRRSQRRRVRPLQWWRGEKLLYGRVHDSLTTVIGIKQSSPGAYARGDSAPFVVESFVPAKYNDLIRFAAI